MRRQQKLKEFFQSDQSSNSDLSEEEDLYEPEQDEQSKKKRGAPKEPLQWTRVFKVSRDLTQEIKIFKLEKDHDRFFAQYNQMRPCTNDSWRPLFDPKDFDAVKNDLKCKDYELNDDEIMTYAKQVTKIRQNIQEKASKVRILEDEQQLEEVKQQSQPPNEYRRIFQGERRKAKSLEKDSDLEFKYHADKPK